jgi:hypothetical protein
MNNYATYGPWDASCFAKTPLAIMENEDNEFISDNQGKQLQITVYPNPSNQNFNLKFVDEDLFEFLNAKLYDYNGRLIFETVLDKNSIQDFSFGDQLTTGLYQLVLQDNEGRIENFRLFKNE